MIHVANGRTRIFLGESFFSGETWLGAFPGFHPDFYCRLFSSPARLGAPSCSVSAGAAAGAFRQPRPPAQRVPRASCGLTEQRAPSFLFLSFSEALVYPHQGPTTVRGSCTQKPCLVFLPPPSQLPRSARPAAGVRGPCRAREDPGRVLHSQLLEEEGEVDMMAACTMSGGSHTPARTPPPPHKWPIKGNGVDLHVIYCRRRRHLLCLVRDR